MRYAVVGKAMYTRRPRTKPPEERRDDLMKAAQRLFLKHGVGPVTIEQITQGADVAKGTFYLYFSSKEDILAALSERFAEDLLAKVDAAVRGQPNHDWKKKLSAWARTCADGYLDSMDLHDILFYGSRPPTREGLVDNVIIDHLTRLLQDGMVAKAWQVEDARFTAVFLFSGLHSVVDDAYSKERRINRPRLARRLEQLSYRVVGWTA